MFMDFKRKALGYHPCVAAAAVIGGAVIGAGASMVSSSKASSAQQAAANTASNTQLQMFNQTQANQAPFLAAGDTALAQMSAGTQAGGQFTHQFNNSDLNSNLAPNYNFQLQQGLGAVNNQNSVTGGLVGGNALKGINDYAQNSAASAYQNAFNNYTTNQTNAYNKLASIAGLGQTAANTSSTTGANVASNIGSAQLAGGAAQAAGYIGQGNAISGIGNAVTGYGMYSGLTNSQLSTYSGDVNSAYGNTTNAAGDNTSGITY